MIMRVISASVYTLIKREALGDRVSSFPSSHKNPMNKNISKKKRKKGKTRENNKLKEEEEEETLLESKKNKKKKK